MNRSQIQRTLDVEYIKAGKQAEIGGTAYTRELIARYVAGGVETPAERAAYTHDQAQAIRDQRRDIHQRVADEFLADPAKRKQAGGTAQRKQTLKELIGAGVDTAEDEEKLGGRNPFQFFQNAAKGRAGIEVFRQIGRAASGGKQAGEAIGSVAVGLNRAVEGASSLFVTAGTAALGLFLSPFGKAGAGVSRLVQGSLQGFQALLGAGGSLIAGGAKLGAGLAGGVVFGFAAALPTGIGAIIGGLAGGPAGALLGASIGATIAAALAGLVGSVFSLVGGVVGQALSAVGQALGQLGHGIADALGNVGSVLSDLTDTGTRFATAINSIARGGGLSAAGAAQYGALGQVVGGSPALFANYFSNFGLMSPYLASRAAAFGVQGVNPNNPASLIQGAYNRYASYGNGPQGVVQRQLLLQGLFPGISQQVGGLFSAGPSVVAEVLNVARRTALTPGQVQQNTRLQFDLSMVQGQLDNVKNRFLTDLMPAINLGLAVFEKFFNGNEGKIVAGLQNVGTWLFVKFPSLLQSGVNKLFTLGEAFASAFPKMFDFALNVLVTALQAIQKISGEIGGNVFVKSLSPTAAEGFRDFAKADLTSGLTGENSKDPAVNAEIKRQLATVKARQSQIDGVSNDFLHGQFPDSSHFTTWAKSKVELLTKERDAAQARADQLNPLSRAVRTGAGFADDWLHKNQPAFNSEVSGVVGSESSRAALNARLIKQSNAEAYRAGQQSIVLELNQKDNPDALYRYEARITGKMAANQVRAMQRAGS